MTDALSNSEKEQKRAQSLPFLLDKNVALRLFTDWIAKVPAAPGGVRHVTPRSIEPMYVPFVRCYAAVTAEWVAEIGKEGRWEKGPSSLSENTDEIWVWIRTETIRGDLPGFSDTVDIFVSATDALERTCLEKIANYGSIYGNTQPVQFTTPPQRMNATSLSREAVLTEAHKRYSSTQNINELRSQATIIVRQKFHLPSRENLPDSQNPLVGVTIPFRFHDEQLIPTFAPVYLVRYQFRGVIYSVLINGQTGDLHGEHPVAAGKVFLWMILMFLPAAALITVNSVLAVQSDFLDVLSVIAIGIGGFFAFSIFYYILWARKKDRSCIAK